MSLALCFISWFYWSCLLCYLAISMRGGSQQWIGIDHVYWCITWYEIILMVPNLISFGSSRWVWKASCLDESARLPFCNDARIARELGKAPSQNSCHYLWWWLFRQLTKCLSYFRKYQAKATIYVVVDRHDRDWSTYKKPIIIVANWHVSQNWVMDKSDFWQRVV